jgi:hypothetical protein
MNSKLLLTIGLIAGSIFLSQAYSQTPFACDRLALDTAARKRHFDELGPALAAIRKDIRELPDGYEFAFPPDPRSVSLLLEWVAGERLCCPFFDIEVRMEREGGSIKLRLTGRNGAKAFIKGDFVRWM